MARKKKFTAEERAAFAEKKKSEMDDMVQRIDEGVKADQQHLKLRVSKQNAQKYVRI